MSSYHAENSPFVRAKSPSNPSHMTGQAQPTTPHKHFLRDGARCLQESRRNPPIHTRNPFSNLFSSCHPLGLLGWIATPENGPQTPNDAGGGARCYRSLVAVHSRRVLDIRTGVSAVVSLAGIHAATTSPAAEQPEDEENQNSRQWTSSLILRYCNIRHFLHQLKDRESHRGQLPKYPWTSFPAFHSLLVDSWPGKNKGTGTPWGNKVCWGLSLR